MAKRLSLIKDMTREAFRQAKYWAQLDNGNRGLKVIQMLSTFLVMDMRDEYEEGKRWIENNYNSCDALNDMQWTFLVSTEYMGSLLSCYALTNDSALLESAKQIGDTVKMEFNKPTGLPNGQDEQSIEMFRDAMDAVVNNRVVQTLCQNHLTYAVREPNKVSTDMDYNACYLGAMLALGANAMQKQLDKRPNGFVRASTVANIIQQQTRIEQHWTLAKKITETCHKHANSSWTKLPSQSESDKTFTFGLAAAYAESYFVLWRLTHETKYRDYAWELAQAIHKECRTSQGKYFQLSNVKGEYQRDKPFRLRFLVSHILKYLYLTFSDDTLLPLDQWVFNRAGQPLPIRGKNGAYPAHKCASMY